MIDSSEQGAAAPSIQRGRCDLCDRGMGPVLVVDVRVPARESIKRLCWPCLIGLARCVDYEVQVAATVIKVLPPEIGSSRPRFGGITRRYLRITGDKLPGSSDQLAIVDPDALIRDLFGRRHGEP